METCTDISVSNTKIRQLKMTVVRWLVQRGKKGKHEEAE